MRSARRTTAVLIGMALAVAGAGPCASNNKAAPGAEPQILTVMSKQATWRYNNSGTDLGTSWRATGFNDRKWSRGTGTMGSGMPGITTNIGRARQTAYFRAGFDVTDPALFESVTFFLNRDDGAVVYVNGREVTRLNIRGRVSYATPASAEVPRNGAATDEIAIPTSALVAGRNVIAVEVHQAGTRARMSRDVRFRGRMSAVMLPGFIPPPPPGDAQQPVSPPPPAQGTRGWRLVTSDEFDGDSLDPAKWLAYDPSNGRGRFGHFDPNVLGCHLARNVSVAQGYATLTSKRENVMCGEGYPYKYSSQTIESKAADKLYPLYGRFEIRARIPHGQGIWTQFWLRHLEGSNTAEVDVIETFHHTDPGSITQTLHFVGNLHAAKKGTYVEKPVVGTGGWHTYAVDIEQVHPGRHDVVKFTFWLDGRRTLEKTVTNASAWTNVQNRDQVWNVTLSTWVGGTHAAHPDKNLGWQAARGGVCALPRPQVRTPERRAATCPKERTPGKTYSYGRAPARDGKPDIWLAPWNYGKKSEYVIDYFRYYQRA